MNEQHVSRKRSRSPERDDDNVKRQRSRSPHRHRERSAAAKLPYKSRHLHRHDSESYRSLFAEYLDLQKQLDIDQLDEDEAKGRWKSFYGKWNRGELAEGWYDPELKERADERSAQTEVRPRATKVKEKGRKVSAVSDRDEEEEEEEDGYGPALPTKGETKHGPTVPGLSDLQYRRELAEEDRLNERADIRYERKQDRLQQKERLEQLAPRAAPGSRERQLEKKRDAAASNKTFAESKDGGTEEVGEGDLMGDDGVDGYKAKLKQTEKHKNEREIRKEETLRARAAEREEKLAEHRRKENKTMDMLKELARQRFHAQV